MKIDISFEGGQKVAASFPDGLQMLTDQPGADGAPGEAPTPFAYFLGSIGTCAGIYVLEFCKARQIPTDRVSLTQHTEFELDQQGKRRVSKVGLTINLPPEFPERYQKAIVKAAELCSVKKAIMHPPEFVVDYQVV
ncbi:OsmC family protein [Trichlorobacter lovleyi]|uniref:OsmC family protein n=1 Tax=Trichlorobacter lovleyi TaxID=313985 RepID=UPI0024802566|nr:OsmC family protein [Trichlorobacter lovleyi]